MLRREREHAQAVVVEQLHPLLGVEARGVPRLVSLLILLLLVERQLQERPRLAAGETLRVEAPVDADAVLDVLERLHRGGRRMFVVCLRYRLHVVLDGSVMRVGRGQADAVVWRLPDSAQQNERRQQRRRETDARGAAHGPEVSRGGAFWPG